MAHIPAGFDSMMGFSYLAQGEHFGNGDDGLVLNFAEQLMGEALQIGPVSEIIETNRS